MNGSHLHVGALLPQRTAGMVVQTAVNGGSRLLIFVPRAAHRTWRDLSSRFV
jgi:hypothetical protein